MLFAEGLENVFRRHRLLAEATRRAVGQVGGGAGDRLQHLRAGGALQLGHGVHHAQGRRAAAAASTTAATSAAWCWAAGSARSRARRFRIAHMGHVNAPMVLGTLGVVEMGLEALGIPHGRGGVQAAVEYLAKAVPA